MMFFQKCYTLPVLGPIQKYKVLHLTTMHAFDMLTSSTLTITTSVASEREWTLVSVPSILTWIVTVTVLRCIEK